MELRGHLQWVLGDETNWYCPSLNEGADITGNASFAIGSNTIVSDTGSGGTNALSFGTVSTSTMDQATDHYGGLADISNSVWIKIDVNNSPNLYTYGSSSKRNPWVFCNPTYLYFQTNVYSEVNTPSNGVWVHFCFVKSGTTQRLYVDGSLASTDACQATTYTNTNGNFVFNSVAKGGFHIDDFRGYTRALTQAEITHLAEARGIEGPPPVGLGDEQLWLCPSLNDSANDISGNGNDGTYNGGMGTVVDTGEGGSLAYDFDGTDDYIDCGAVFRPTGNFSISFWALNDTTARAMYVSKNWDGTSEGYVSRYDGGAGDLKFYTYSSGITYGTDVANPLTTSQWSCVTNVYNGTHWEIYIDGVLVSQTAQTQPPYDSPSGLWIGATSVGGWNLDGRMDDIRMFDRALTQAEITHLSSQRGVEGPPPAGLGDEQLWLCPSINDSAADISGSGNDGTYQGGMGTITDTSNGGSRCFAFDGTDDYIDCGDITSSDQSEFAFSLWVNRVNNDSNVIAAKRDDSNYDWDISKAGSNAVYFGPTDNANRANSGSSTLGLNSWDHVVCQITGSQVEIYFNGSIVGTHAYSGGVIDSAASMTIGRRAMVGNNAGWFTGKMDDIRTYNRALTQSEITHLATSRGIEGGPTFTGLGDEQLWLCPSLDDSADDISGYGNDGTYNGGMGTISDTSNGGSLAYQFDGTNDYIDCGSSASLDKTSDDPVSQSGWVKVVETTNTQFILLPKSLGGNTYIGTHLTIKNGLLSLRLINTLNSNELQVETGTTLTTGWHHIAFSYDGSLSSSGVSIYLDGASQSLSSITSTLVTGSPVTFVGGSMLVSTRSSLDFTPDNGTLQDDLRLFNRVLTQAEITHLATSRGIEGPAGTPPVTPDVFFNPFQSKTFFPNYTRRIR